MLRPILLSYFLFFVVFSQAQQLDLTTLYRNNWQVINPAATNLIFLENRDKQYSFNAAYRNQWVGFEGSPASYNARFEYYPKTTTTKMGFFVLGDQTGAISTNGIYGNFAYQIPLNYEKSSYISIGLNAGGVFYNVNRDEIRFQSSQSQYNGTGTLNQSYVDMGLGIFYRWKSSSPIFDRSSFFLSELYAGLSVPQTFTLNFNRAEEGVFDLERIQHYYLITGTVLEVYEGVVTIEPSLWVRFIPNTSTSNLFQNVPFSADFNTRVLYQKKYWLGAGAGTNNTLHFEVGYNLYQSTYEVDAKNFTMTLGIGADVPYGQVSWLGPSAEISLGVGWN